MDSPRRPLAELEVLDHIHGCVVLQPENGTPFHSFGYWDAGDACLGQWWAIFTRIQQHFDAGGDFVYECPYPDQGDPQLQFIVSGQSVVIRTTFYHDDNWTDVEETSEQSTTRVELEKLISDALALSEYASPSNGLAWLERNRGETESWTAIRERLFAKHGVRDVG